MDRTRQRIAIAVLLAACVPGCATYETSSAPSAVVIPARTQVVSARRAADAVVIGRSTRADVLAALGQTQVISFDSGFEVWVYRLAGDTSAGDIARRRADAESRAEFVILFAPSGLVTKTRIRQAPLRG